ncbi:DUF2017 family protein [uncultured Jatrophihabitans sp.]|uniref:DUF2017 family protein n=1 Tax=uncultured Jatrophihabitans sp. TaxID=1610747 RepID=UPI0035CA1290
MNVSHKRGHLRLHLDPVEVDILTSLLAELDTAVRASDTDDPVTARLYPSANRDDADIAAAYRNLTESGLRDDRIGRIAACVADLANNDLDLGDPADATRWIQVLNDLRLALGTRLGISEDDDEIDLTDPEQHPRVLYHWLTAVQDTVVSRLMR